MATASIPQPLPERFQGVGPFAVSHKRHRAAVQVEHNRQIAMSFADGIFSSMAICFTRFSFGREKTRRESQAEQQSVFCGSRIVKITLPLRKIGSPIIVAPHAESVVQQALGHAGFSVAEVRSAPTPEEISISPFLQTSVRKNRKIRIPLPW